ncbi:hypothetical protein IWX49DRAFT_287472 [Phyllosticta citricarpa]
MMRWIMSVMSERQPHSCLTEARRREAVRGGPNNRGGHVLALPWYDLSLHLTRTTPLEDDIVLPLLFPSLLDPAAAEWIAHWTTSSPIGRDLGPDADVKAVLLTTTLETALERRATETTPGISNVIGSTTVSRTMTPVTRPAAAATAPNDFPAVALMPKESGYKIRVENLHYELTEDDIYELFERIGPVENARLMYDRHDRSEGVAFVTYRSLADARVACREYDGANAHGQPIRLTLVPPGPAPRRNPSDTAQRPSRSLFERIETRDRSLSPDRVRRSDVTKPPPAGIDRYVPGEDSGRRRSPPPPRRRGGGRESGRRPGERRTGGRGGRRADDDGRPVVQGRPRKTQDELDAEMEDYWGVGHDGAADAPVNGSGDVQSGPADPGAAANNAINDDIEMEVE